MVPGRHVVVLVSASVPPDVCGDNRLSRGPVLDTSSVLPAVYGDNRVSREKARAFLPGAVLWFSVACPCCLPCMETIGHHEAPSSYNLCAILMR